ncbi:Pseudouridine-5'-phosphate glycosidase [Pseudocercospora fuligena]|uniref:Pseudouridine-5'-phosphate glycosidase n=1 Tax=Pseudocercospora fuligena TaxID=685502 RepID=A0A8H6VM53_9PEZI|nr:Pseudouridine-5'-phosphate glycosidase [Pseudocercospora fuligena]
MSVLPWIFRACRSTNAVHGTTNIRRLQHRSIASNSRYFQVSEEVRQAISEKKPVVALESTIYTHGFPYPENLALASRLESLVRINGAVPATIGILEGVARVGLGADELMRLISEPGSPDLLKVSRRDLGFVLGLKNAQGKPLNGGTTVSGTMVLAHMACIKIFGTGGLGGVHRGAEQTMDVSADLTELGRTPVAVISSGCKSFLDIPKTLEYLETQGVAVATFADGRVGNIDFPAFYTRESGVKSPMVLPDEEAAAHVIMAQQSLGLQSGLHFANPIPEQHSVAFEVMEKAIDQALEAALAAGATGNAVTPYILAKIKEITGSKSVEANTALVEANVIRAARVAVALQRLEQSQSNGQNHQSRSSSSVITGPGSANYTAEGISTSLASKAKPHPPLHTPNLQSIARSKPAPTASHSPASSHSEDAAKNGSLGVNDTMVLSMMQEYKKQFQNSVDDLKSALSSPDQASDIFVAGSLAVDLACDFNPRPGSDLQSPELQTSNPAQIVQSLGGVGHNVARAAHLMGAKVRLCSAIADDLTGKAALEALSFAEMSTAGIKSLPSSDGNRTAQYIAINDKNKDLVLAMADMSILEKPSTLTQTFENFWLPQLQTTKPSHLVLDGNWSPDYLSLWLQSNPPSTTVTFEPVSKAKSITPFTLPNILKTYPNPSIHLTTPNTHELSSMHIAARKKGLFDREDWWKIIDSLGIPHSGARTQMSLAASPKLVDEGVPQMSIQLLPFIPCILTKLGSEGVLLTQILPAGDERLASGDYAPYILSRNQNQDEGAGVGGVYMRLFPAVEEVREEEFVSVNGVGDTFLGTLLAGLVKRGKGARVEEMVDLAQRAAVLTLKSRESVSSGLGTLRLLL